ncbi:hypothetical protein AKJ41_00745 [candidate division MSBL1 archaeon SCGC-AAA259O05]|uniref:Stage II sporulation protein M n=1 Tax=candidate division MSBL1 archaeon SCGC-AAA259O05 TaxID=1698271 RepID=A0A133V5D6_9EURY|nr:hypothetical protein AKJ41_00745 [candidate division MSBL1 archaeon SCGC-AAA259O05]
MTEIFRTRLASALFVASGSLVALVFVLSSTVGGDPIGVLVHFGGMTITSGHSRSPALLLSIYLNNLSVLLLASLGPIAFTFLVAWSSRLIGGSERNVCGEDEGRLHHQTLQRLSATFLLYGSPALVMIVNGGALGLFLTATGLYGGVEGIQTFVIGVAPHGAVEIPAIVLGAALGFSVADDLMDPLASGDPKEAQERAKNLILDGKTQGSVLILAALLVLAAIIEVYPVF